jgi:hypothetical protein
MKWHVWLSKLETYEILLHKMSCGDGITEPDQHRAPAPQSSRECEPDRQIPQEKSLNIISSRHCEQAQETLAGLA